MPDTATPPAGEPDEAPQEQPEATEEPVFANRAERRAKGRGKSSVPPEGRAKGFPGGRGSVQAQRQWGNRRTG